MAVACDHSAPTPCREYFLRNKNTARVDAAAVRPAQSQVAGSGGGGQALSNAFRRPVVTVDSRLAHRPAGRQPVSYRRSALAVKVSPLNLDCWPGSGAGPGAADAVR